MHIAKNKIVLSTGREIHCLGPNIGMSLTETPKGWRITTGFDDVIHAKVDGSWHDDALSHEEAREVADYMIAVWTEYKDSIPD